MCGRGSVGGDRLQRGVCRVRLWGRADDRSHPCEQVAQCLPSYSMNDKPFVLTPVSFRCFSTIFRHRVQILKETRTARRAKRS